MRIRWTHSAVRDLHPVLPFYLSSSKLTCWESAESTEEQVGNPTQASLCLPGYRILRSIVSTKAQ
jgi:hypothetical protein